MSSGEMEAQMPLTGQEAGYLTESKEVRPASLVTTFTRAAGAPSRTDCELDQRQRSVNSRRLLHNAMPSFTRWNQFCSGARLYYEHTIVSSKGFAKEACGIWRDEAAPMHLYDK